MMRRAGRAFVFLLAAACDRDPTASDDPKCGRQPAYSVTLAPLEATTLTAERAACVRLADGGRYMLIPQFANADLPYARLSFALGPASGAGLNASQLFGAPPGPGAAEPVAGTQQRLDALLRQSEQRVRDRRPAQLRATAAPLPSLNALANFNVLSTLSAPFGFTQVGARVRYIGANLIVAVDTATPAGMSSDDWARLGAFLDGPLFELDRARFGAPSDIDGNARVTVVFTPVVNALVTQLQCATSGFVSGFFYHEDLAEGSANSNRGEIVYAYVPDPAGRFSCPHTREDVQRALPVTFVHELQHLISYGRRVIEGGGVAEEQWLNEGLSHLAEELASRLFEDRYPGASGRSNPVQLFPDSAAPFITNNLLNAYAYLERSADRSIAVNDPLGYGSIEERGAAWLFLRWLLDHHPGALAALMQPGVSGVRNVERATSSPFSRLLGDFSLALVMDSISGVPRASQTSTHRFTSRNLRQLFAAVHAAYPGRASRPFPVVPVPLDQLVLWSMRPATARFFEVQASQSRALRTIVMQGADGAPLAAALRAQLGIVRLPD